MQDLCPLCLKSGIRKKIKLLQINLQEAVWMCEEEKCIWPFGYEDFVFCPRVVGKNWSYNWDDYKLTTSRLKENVVTTVKPLVTVNHELSKEIINNLDIHSSENINIISNSTNLTDTKTIFNDTFACGDFVHIEEQCKEDNILNREITTNNVNVIDNNTKVENECINSLNRHNEEKDGISIQNVKNMNNVKESPRITSIEKTNIDISNVKIGNQISAYQEPYKEVLSINKPIDTIGTKLTSEVEKLSNLEPTKSNENVPKSNLSITMMEIDGLPPITLSFEIPVCTTIPETVVANTQQTAYKNNNLKSSSPQTKNTFMKRITSGKQYEKFSFSVIKKKIESNKFNNTNNSNNNSNSLNVKTDRQTESNGSNNTSKSNNDSNSLNVNTNPKIENVKNDLTNSTKTKNCENFYTPNVSYSNDYKQTIPNVSATCVSNQLYNSITCLSSQENISSDNLAVNTNVNIDTVLEDFLTNDYNVSEDINDEWINSLLS